MSTADTPVSAVLVTRGDVDLTEIILNLAPAVDEIVIWNNDPAATYDDHMAASLTDASCGDGDAHVCPVVWANTEQRDLKVYGRYAAIRATRSPLILVQDDDCILEAAAVRELVATYMQAVRLDTVVANMPAPFRAHYSDSCLVGFGAVFHRDTPARAFDRYLPTLQADPHDQADVFLRCCDVVFTTLTPAVWADVPYRNLPWATGEDRMYRQPSHNSERAEMLRVARAVRGA